MTNSNKHIYLTGMSGTGKSSTILSLQERGFVAIDTDYDNWKIFSITAFFVLTWNAK
ncbi:MAG: hypothetical protein ACRC8Z_04875 [Empedobacter falsenii]